MEFSDIRIKARDILNDPDGNRWIDAELDDYINEAQRFYAIKAKELTAEAVLYANATGVVGLPEDFIAVLRFIDINGKDIPLRTWQDLADEYNPKFMDDISDEILAVYVDYESWNKLRSYPKLADGSEIGTLTYARMPVDDTIEVRYDLPLVYYSVYKCYLREGEEYLKKAFYYYGKFSTELSRTVIYDKNISISGTNIHGEYF